MKAVRIELPEDPHEVGVDRADVPLAECPRYVGHADSPGDAARAARSHLVSFELHPSGCQSTLDAGQV